MMELKSVFRNIGNVVKKRTAVQWIKKSGFEPLLYDRCQSRHLGYRDKKDIKGSHPWEVNILE